MYRIICFLVFVAFQGALAQSDCVPDPVDNLRLSLNYTLSWSPSVNCNVTHYIIYIHSNTDDLEYIYQTDDTYLLVTFLPACERYRFTVMAYDQHMSTSTFIIANIPAPPEANLTMSYFTVIEQDGGIWLHWGVDYLFAHCAQYYRIIIWDYTSQPRDIYTSYTDVFIDDLRPCTSYEVGVMAIYNVAIEGPAALRTYDAKPLKVDLPVLQRVVPGSRNAYLTWSLPSYSDNPCPISAIIVDGSPNFNRSYPVIDSPTRSPVTVNVNPLQSDSMYVFRVSVVNSAGVSDSLPIGVQTLP